MMDYSSDTNRKQPFVLHPTLMAVCRFAINYPIPVIMMTVNIMADNIIP